MSKTDAELQRLTAACERLDRRLVRLLQGEDLSVVVTVLSQTLARLGKATDTPKQIVLTNFATTVTNVYSEGESHSGT